MLGENLPNIHLHMSHDMLAASSDIAFPINEIVHNSIGANENLIQWSQMKPLFSTDYRLQNPMALDFSIDFNSSQSIASFKSGPVGTG